MKILFVCTANLCRSAAAEKLLLHYGAAAGWQARSRGTAAGSLGGMPGPVKDFLLAAGVADPAHKAQFVMEEDIAWADLVLPMEEHHFEALAERFPQSLRKMRLFLDYCHGTDGQGLIDPAGQSRAVFARVLGEIDKGIKIIVARGPGG